MRARILIIKLCFLFKTVNSDLTLSARVFRSLAASDVESLVITRQCRFLESIYKSNYTTAVLTFSNRSLQKEILQLDLSLLLADASINPSQQYVQAVASSNVGSWLKLWDLALERGAFGTTCVQAILRFLSLHGHSDGICPVPKCSFYVGSESPCDHFLSAHTSLDIILFMPVQTSRFHYSLMVMFFIIVVNLYESLTLNLSLMFISLPLLTHPV